MPVEVIENADPLTSLVRFRTSTVYEMLTSLSSVLVGQRHTELLSKLRGTLGDSFVEELRDLCDSFGHGIALFEFAVDYPDHHDVPGFIQYVRKMNAETFLFYLIGRVIPPKRIAATHGDAHTLVEAMDVYPHHPD